MGGSEVFHGAVHGFDQRQHRLLQLALELRFMGLEPLPAVISPQAAQESEPGFTKVRFAGDVWEWKRVMNRVIAKQNGMSLKAAISRAGATWKRLSGQVTEMVTSKDILEILF